MTASPDIQLVAIVNSFNRLSLLKIALPALTSSLAKVKISTAIVIFEAKSSDGSREWIEEFRQSHLGNNIHIVEPAVGEDDSFAAGVNAACSHASGQFPSAPYFFLFETDNWIQSELPLNNALELLESQPEMGAVGFTVQKYSGVAGGYGCRFPSKFDFALGQQAAARLKLDIPNNTPWNSFGESRWRFSDVVFTSPLIVRRSAWEDVDGFDAVEFPFSDCDLDLAWRLRQKNWRMAVLDTKEVVHDNKDVLSSWSTTRTLNFHRARLKLLQRHRGQSVRWLKLFLFLRHCLEILAITAVLWRSKRLRGSLQQRLALAKGVFRSYKPS